MAVREMPAIFLFDRRDERLGTLPVLESLAHTEELGGEDTIEFDCALAPVKEDLLLWRDPDDGRWREHVVVRTDETWGGSAHVYAKSALSEFLGEFVEDRQLMLKTPDAGLAAVPEATRWEAGTIDVPAHQRSCYLYHTNALAALRRVEEVWEGEAEMGVEVDDLRVARRSVSLRRRIGGWRGAWLTYGKNAASCTRTVLEDEMFTAFYGFGRGLPILDESGSPPAASRGASRSPRSTAVPLGSATRAPGSDRASGTRSERSGGTASGRSSSPTARTRTG